MMPINTQINNNNNNNNENEKEKEKKLKRPKTPMNYKPKSLKEYRDKYINVKEEKSGGLGPNIGTEEWNRKKNINDKIKKYSEKIKEKNEGNFNNNKNHSNIKINKKNSEIVKNQLYDSLDEEITPPIIKKENSNKNSVKILSNRNNNNNQNEINNNSYAQKSMNKINFLKNLQKDKKYSKYKIITINNNNNNNINENQKEAESNLKNYFNEKKNLNRIYTTLNQPENKNKISKNKISSDYKTPFDRKRAQSSKQRKNIKFVYDDDLTKKFLINEGNEYNGYINNNNIIKKNNNNVIVLNKKIEINPSTQIEYLLKHHNKYNKQVNQIKQFINNNN